MLRWTGVLAILASVVLVAVLLNRTTRRQVVGIMTARPGNSVAGANPSPAVLGGAKLRITVPVRSVWPPNDWPPYVDGFKLADAELSGEWQGEGEDEKNEKSSWTWVAEAPEEVMAAGKPGDEVILTAMILTLPGFDDVVRYVRYEFRSGPKTWAVGRPSNSKFILVYALAAGGSLLLWAVGCGVALLCGVKTRSKSAIRD